MAVVEGRRPRIAFVTAFDLQEIQHWSWAGTFQGMMRALQLHCGDVEYVGPVRCVEQQLARVRSRAARLVFGRDFVRYHCRLVSKRYGKLLGKRLGSKPYDVVVAPGGETEVAYLQTLLPIVLVEDAPYGRLIDYYEDYSNLLPSSVREMQSLEVRALARATAVVVPTSWAAQSVIADYGTSAAKVHVAPFGANFDRVPSRELAISPRPTDRLRLLFVGASWSRKGGDIALEALGRLVELGIDAELTVLGCSPPPGTHHARMRVIPYLNKGIPTEREQLEQLYRTSHFLFLPTRSECVGMVFIEASAHGLPVVATDTGGVSDVVRHDETGFLLPPDARGSAYAVAAASIYQDRPRYTAMVRAARDRYEERLNWDAWGAAVSQIIAGLVGPGVSSQVCAS